MSEFYVTPELKLTKLRIPPIKTKHDAFEFANSLPGMVQPETHIFFRVSNDLLFTLLLRVSLGNDFSEEEKTVETVFDILSNPDGLAYLESLFKFQNVFPYIGKNPTFGEIYGEIYGLIVMRSSLLCNVITYSTNHFPLCLECAIRDHAVPCVVESGCLVDRISSEHRSVLANFMQQKDALIEEAETYLKEKGDIPKEASLIPNSIYIGPASDTQKVCSTIFCHAGDKEMVLQDIDGRLRIFL